MYDALPEYTALQTAKLFCNMLAKALMYRPLIYANVTLPLKRGAKPAPVRVSIKPKKICSGVRAMYAAVKESMPEQIKQRQAAAEERKQTLLQMSGVKRVWYGENAFMLIAECNDPKALQTELWMQGIDSATHFGNSINWANEFGYKDNDCPMAEKLIKHLLMLPITINL